MVKYKISIKENTTSHKKINLIRKKVHLLKKKRVYNVY